MVSRRTVITGGAGAAVLAALGYRAWDRGVFASGEGPAFAAWQEWQGHPGEGPARPLHAAILAASAHNAQPWLFEPAEDAITVYADLTRNLGAADPFRRELYFSLGCAWQNIVLSSKREARASLVSFPLKPNPAAGIEPALKIEFTAAPNLSNTRDWLAAIAKRHTHRGPYLPDRAVAAPFLDIWSLANPEGARIAFIRDAAAKRDMAALIEEATRRFIADKTMSHDSGRWFRTGRREIEARRDGVSTDTAGLSPFMNGIAKMLPDQDAASADKYWLAATRDVQLPTAAAFGVLFTPDRLQAGEAIAAGAAWQKLHLDATARGIAMQPLNQPLEMMDRDLLLGRKNDYAKEIRQLAGVDAGDPAFIFRLGYAEDEARPSPRRRFEDVIRRTGFA
jgi:hypothetical protein